MRFSYLKENLRKKIWHEIINILQKHASHQSDMTLIIQINSLTKISLFDLRETLDWTAATQRIHHTVNLIFKLHKWSKLKYLNTYWVHTQFHKSALIKARSLFNNHVIYYEHCIFFCRQHWINFEGKSSVIVLDVLEHGERCAAWWRGQQCEVWQMDSVAHRPRSWTHLTMIHCDTWHQSELDSSMAGDLNISLTDYPDDYPDPPSCSLCHNISSLNCHHTGLGKQPQ